MWKIGNVKISNQIVLAPMAGISDSAFRRIAKEMGCGLVVAEMVSDKAILYGSQKTIDMLYMKDEERPISQQIFGSDKESFVYAAKYIEQHMHPDIIDINMGCPVPKVATRAQAGSALLKDPNKVYEIVKAVVDSVNVPVTVKIRSGWDEKSINALEIAKVVEKAGASAITVHPRTRSQGYSGKANWQIIKEVKESVSIPVIGNGDITSALDAKKMFEETNCDAIMIGRAAIGNPWIFKECKEYIENNLLIAKPTDKEKIDMIKTHYQILKKDKNEKLALLEIRTHALAYIKGMKEAKVYKDLICKAKTEHEFLNVLDKYQAYLN